MTLREIRLVAGKELRETLRDRRTLAVMILFPLVVYPLVSLVTTQVMAARFTRVETRPSRVAVNGPAALAEQVRARLAAGTAGKDISLMPPAKPEDVSANRVDAVVQVAAPATGRGPPAVRIFFDQTRETSRTAQERIAQALSGAADPTCPPAYTIDSEGIAPRTSVSGYLLSKILPLVVVVMVMLGAFHPAIDITAGERERNTLETTLSAPISRVSLMTGKVLAVATLAAITGFLNLASMSLTVLEGARLVSDQITFTIPWRAVGAALAVVPPTAFLFASVMVAAGSIARSFKEAQTLLTPVYFLCMAPSLTAALGDFPLSGVALVFPGVNVTLLARDLVLGQATATSIVVVFATTLGYGAAALALAARLYDSERLLGADDATLSLSAWLRRVAMGSRGGGGGEVDAASRPGTTAGHAITLYAFAWIVLLASIPLQTWHAVGQNLGLLMFEWLGLGGLVAIYARGTDRRLRTVLRWRRPSFRSLAGAVLIGASAWLVVGLLATWIAPAPKEVVDSLRRVIAPPGGERGILLTLFLMAVTPAVCEEMLFRGPILRGFATRFSPTGAAILTGLLFGLYHGDVWRFLPTAVLGVMLSAIALRADSIIPAMVAHFVNNASLVILARLSLDGTDELSRGATALLLSVGAVVLGSGFTLLFWSGRTRRVM